MPKKKDLLKEIEFLKVKIENLELEVEMYEKAYCRMRHNCMLSNIRIRKMINCLEHFKRWHLNKEDKEISKLIKETLKESKKEYRFR